ncbi:MAG: hypothetical protein ACXAEN_26535 [Candidatus Thorarchaeota archaeon]|jgi:hypothetical protein
MTEIPVDTQLDEPREEGFRRSEKFEINDRQFKEITVDKNRIMAIAKKWARFELLISCICAAWMEKWRRFSLKVLAAGAVLIGFPFFSAMIPLLGPIIVAGGYVFILFFMFVGLVLIAIWALFKRESLLLFTPGGMFKIEGSAGFVEDVWKEVVRHQRSRDV